MTLKPGSKGVLQLGQGFDEPRWREALVVGIQKPWLQALVRCSKKELELTALSSVEKEDQPFCLVEAMPHQLLSGVNEEVMPLGASAQDLLRLGLQALMTSDEDLNYATASDPAERRAAARSKAKAADSESEESSGEELEDLTTQLKKNWLGSGTADEKAQKLQDRASSSKHRSRRFALIERKKASKSGGAPSRQGQDAMIQAAMQTGAQSKASWPFSLRSLSRKNARAGGTEAVQGAEIETALQTAAAASQQKSGKKMFRHPVKYIRRFVKSVEEELGAQDKPFRWALPS